MKKCKGCGRELQYEDPGRPGYAPDDSFEYCQRCFRLSHYGDISCLKKTFKDNATVIDIYRKTDDALFVVVFDVFEALVMDQDDYLDHFKGKDIVIVINKIDLLPKNITEEKIDRIFADIVSRLQGPNIIDCLLTYRNDRSFNDLFFAVLKESGYRKAVFAGRANAGKSTLINKLIRTSDLTVSIYPGTTVDSNEIVCGDHLFIDTPGLLDEGSVLSYIDNSKIKKILPLKTIKAQNFQLYEEQSYLIEGLIRVDIRPLKNASLSFLVNNDIAVHRCRTDRAEGYLNKHLKDLDLKIMPFSEHRYEVKDSCTFIVKGLGLFRVKGKAVLNIHLNDKIMIYTEEVSI
ncbi:MAG: 50S ribosome-binding GTPase [Erysipelotrichaceae bacterium]|nr:50S ribosome-binding GTPase [Erysipelotrichaceae bacterium]